MRETRAIPRPPIDGIDLVLGPGFHRWGHCFIVSRNQSCEYSNEEFAVKTRLFAYENNI